MKPMSYEANLWLHSSIGRALRRYHGGHGFERCWSPDFVWGFFPVGKIGKLTAMITLHIPFKYYSWFFYDFSFWLLAWHFYWRDAGLCSCSDCHGAMLKALPERLLEHFLAYPNCPETVFEILQTFLHSLVNKSPKDRKDMTHYLKFKLFWTSMNQNMRKYTSQRSVLL